MKFQISEQNYYNRQIKIWGENKQISLKNKKVVIIGAGGLGCSLALALSGTGIGRIDIVDFDKVSISNIHRQISFNIQDENKEKANILSSSIKKRNPFIKSEAYILDFKSFIKEERKYNLILDATDNMESRLEIDIFSKSKNIPWIYGSIEEFCGQVCFFQKSSYEIFNKKHNHKVTGNFAAMVMNIASFQASLAIRYLLDINIIKDKLYYINFEEQGDFSLKSFFIPT